MIMFDFLNTLIDDANLCIGAIKQTECRQSKQESQETPRGFREYIKFELDKRADADRLFAKTYAKSNKSLDECIKYIVGEMFKKCVREGNTGFAVNDMADNSDLVALAIHYYDEDDIRINPINGSVMVKGQDEKVPQMPKTEQRKPKTKKVEVEDEEIFTLEDFM